MKLEKLTAVSPIDGRYRNKTESLDSFFSEFALIKYRVKVEVEYFISLCELPLPQLASADKKSYRKLREIVENFTIEEAKEIKEIENTTNHDVKAVEYFLKRKFDTNGLSEYKEFIHFGLTSQDINNTATPLSLKDGINDVFKPIGNNIQDLEMYIFNRWGERIFETTVYPSGTDKLDAGIIEGGWNGRYMNRGKYVEVGTYTWYVELKTVNNDKREHSGAVTVIR